METCLVRCSHGGSTLFRALKPPLSMKLPNSLSFMAIHTDGGRSIKRAYDALFLDAGGTLLQLAKPVGETYATIGSKYGSEHPHLAGWDTKMGTKGVTSGSQQFRQTFGLSATSAEIKQGFKRAFAAPWPEKLHYQGDGRPFWKLVVSEATGCADDDYFEEVYEYYAKGDAWRLPDGAYETIALLKDAGVKVAVVSNFDTRLRKLLKDLNVLDLFDAVIISSEVGYEKPDIKIFKAALECAIAIDQVHVEADKAVHVGDDQKADKVGANSIGIECWLWGVDIKTFSDIGSRILISES